jgi:transcriptional regulator NrdR family protein
MLCPSCGGKTHSVVTTRNDTIESIIRKRRCSSKQCGQSWWTGEFELPANSVIYVRDQKDHRNYPVRANIAQRPFLNPKAALAGIEDIAKALEDLAVVARSSVNP